MNFKFIKLILIIIFFLFLIKKKDSYDSSMNKSLGNNSKDISGILKKNNFRKDENKLNKNQSKEILSYKNSNLIKEKKHSKQTSISFFEKNQEKFGLLNLNYEDRLFEKNETNNSDSFENSFDQFLQKNLKVKGMKKTNYNESLNFSLTQNGFKIF